VTSTASAMFTSTSYGAMFTSTSSATGNWPSTCLARPASVGCHDGSDKHRSDLSVAPCQGHLQCCCTRCIYCCCHRCITAQQQLHHTSVASNSCTVQWREAFCICC
jgi:hypothetical protein